MTPAQGRPLKPLSADADPLVAAVAEVLRDLRLRAGLSLRQLSTKCNYSPATLSMAASGKSLPRLEVVEAYVRGCFTELDEDPERVLEEIRGKWIEARRAQDAPRSDAVSGTEPVGARHPVPDTPAGEGETRRTRRSRRSAPMSFADAVEPAEHSHKTSNGGLPSHPTVSAARRERSVKPTVPLRDPGDSVQGLVHQAHLMSNNSSQTALNLCSTPEHFIELLSRLRERSELSFRDLSNRCRQNGYPVSKSTLHDLLRGKELPSTELLHAFLHSCGCDPADWMAWHQTRTRLKIAQLLARPDEHEVIGLLRRDRFSRTAVLSVITFIMLVGQVITAFLLMK
ncbi:helix-turn-helix domain-containing protein [Streptomyces fungicidicus]|uniref:helix-turn-helix domain-containing protein n=1 Tax=Streptomyces fungicidicus TaxID=68203 RepID=UPI0036B0C794